MNLAAFVNNRRSEIRPLSDVWSAAQAQPYVDQALQVFNQMNPDYASTDKGKAAGALYDNKQKLSEAYNYLIANAHIPDRNAQGQIQASKSTPPAVASAESRILKEIERQQTVFDYTAAAAPAAVTNITTTTTTQVNPTVATNVQSPGASTTVTQPPQTVIVPQDINTGTITTPAPEPTTTTPTPEPTTPTPTTSTPTPTTTSPAAAPSVTYVTNAPTPAGTDTGYLQSPQQNYALYAIAGVALVGLLFFHEKR